MATNFFFNNFQSSMEQRLYEELIIESIKIYGHDVFYIPRTQNNHDDVYGADDQSSYDQAFPVEMYIRSYDNFEGDGDFMSKFGIEIRNRVIFSLSQRVFTEEVAATTNQVRPNEGDLIYFPLNGKCFQIKYVNKFEMFYPLGALQTWELTAELFEYSNESFNTGITEIDEIQTLFSTNFLNYRLLDEDGNSLQTEDADYLILEGYAIEDLLEASDNEEIQTESDAFVDFTATDPFSDGNI